jgi:hypothetical protein
MTAGGATRSHYLIRLAIFDTFITGINLGFLAHAYRVALVASYVVIVVLGLLCLHILAHVSRETARSLGCESVRANATVAKEKRK